jgi:hypothetical protein
MAVAPPHDAGVRPVFAQAFGHVLDDTPYLRALGRTRPTDTALFGCGFWWSVRP